ncbi:hypothetical protein MBLNU459_g5902t2 [Dothideomycetes sp. NU459]
MHLRRILASGLAAATVASAGSPAYTAVFQSRLPIAPIATPYTSANIDGQQIDFYEITIEAFQKHIYPDLGPANLYGYNGFAPGPTFFVRKGTQTVVRYDNNKTDDSVTHLHGSWSQIKDYYYSNDQSARSLWYHDHANGITTGNCFKGLTGVYVVYDPAEDALGLPTGKYDVPLMITDKMYSSSGDLVDVTELQNDFFGDIIEVNHQPWPYFEVEPRKYRLRLYNVAMSRPFDLHIEQPDGDWINFQIIASDSGLFEAPVASNDVLIAMGERYEIVVDFSGYSGQNLTMKNTFTLRNIPSYENTNLVMSFVVGESVSDWSSNEVPSTLSRDIVWPQTKTDVDHTFRFSFGGDNHWTINGVSFDDVNNRVLARPPQGTTELWKLVYASGPGVHPVHVHLVDFQIVSRSGGSRGVLPYESAGMKDVVLIEPGETVEVLAYYGPWNGLYMFHCHNLVHEDHEMMAAYNITALEDLGYENVQDLADPNDARFVAQEWSAEAYSYDNIQSKLSYLGGLGAYNQRTQMVSALAAYYSTNPAAALESSTIASTASSAAATPTQSWQNDEYATSQVHDAVSAPAVTRTSTPTSSPTTAPTYKSPTSTPIPTTTIMSTPTPISSTTPTSSHAGPGEWGQSLGQNPNPNQNHGPPNGVQGWGQGSIPNPNQNHGPPNAGGSNNGGHGWRA